MLDDDADPWDRALIPMGAHVQARGGERRGDVEEHETRAQRERQADEPGTTHRDRTHRLATVRACHHVGSAQVALLPGPRRIAHVVAHRHERVPGGALPEVGGPDPVEVGARGEQAETDGAEALLEHVVLVEGARPHGDVGLAPRQHDVTSALHELHLERGMLERERRERGRDPSRRDPLARRDADAATDACVAASEETIDGERIELHPLHVAEDRATCGRERVRLRRALEEARVEARLERAQSTTERGLCEPHAPRRARERSFARDREHQAEIVPVHPAIVARWRVPRAVRERMGAIRSLRSRASRRHRSLRGMQRRAFLGAMAVGAAACGGGAVGLRPPSAEPAAIRGVAFDLFTIFDPRSADAAVSALFPSASAGLPLAWRTRAFEHAWIRACAGRYVDFRRVLAEALVPVAAAEGISPTEGEIERAIAAFEQLTPWPDAREVLVALGERGLGRTTLANFSPLMIERLLTGAGLDDVFDHRASTDEARTFKPDPRAYAIGERALGLPRASIAFAAFGSWDAAGASWFGYPTFWVNRLAVAPDPLVALGPTGPSLRELARWIEEGAPTPVPPQS